MWIFLNNAFLSIVQDKNDPNRVLVRARFRDDIKHVFPDARVLITPNADYRYRTNVDRATVAIAIAQQVMSIDYPNFKNSVTEDARHRLYLRIWDELWWAQKDAIRKTTTKRGSRKNGEEIGL